MNLPKSFPWLVAAAAVLAVGRVRFSGGRLFVKVRERRQISVDPPISEEAQWMPLDSPGRRYFESGSGFAPYVT